MPAVQTDYQERINEFYEGQVINPHTCDVSTYIAGAIVGFGLAVKRGDDDKKIVVGVDPAAGAADEGGTGVFGVRDFYGITIKDPTRDPEEEDNYMAGGHVNVLWRGDIVVKVGTAVSAGSPVRVAADTGAFTGAAAAAAVRTIVGARFLRDATAGGCPSLGCMVVNNGW